MELSNCRPRRVRATMSGLLINPLVVCAQSNSDKAVDNLSTASLTPLVIITLAILAIVITIVVGLTLWGRRQDQMNNMTFFCIGYMLNSLNKPDLSAAAKALGNSDDPEAMLLLVDVVNDDTIDEVTRRTAQEALVEMRNSCPKYSDVIDKLTSAIAISDEKTIANSLMQQFENKEGKYVQSAYLVGRSLLRLGEYEDARGWLRTAAQRNLAHPVPMYQGRIGKFVEQCNKLLFLEGDSAYIAGDYHQANALYASAAHGLTDQERRGFASFLRSTCAYIKMGDYRNAHDALLQALHHQQETDLSLELSSMVSNLINPDSGLAKGDEKYQQQERKLREHADRIMEHLHKELRERSDQA